MGPYAASVIEDYFQLQKCYVRFIIIMIN